MKILNIMLSRILGGTQQAFLDYNSAIEMSNNELVIVTSKLARINKQITKNHYELPNFLSFDPISIFALRRIIKKVNPDVIIAHGNRAINFSYYASLFLKKRPILVGVAHNYQYNPLLKCDFVFSITNYLKNFLTIHGMDSKKIFLMPNCINCVNYNFHKKKLFSGKVLKIGVLSRFVDKKGVDVLIRSLPLIKEKNIQLEAHIGGEGEDYRKLLKLVKELNLEKEVKFMGWVEDKEEFFKNVDIFCLPSRQEPFGIIILEAMLSKTPIISTKTEGPNEILTNRKNSLLIEPDSPEQIANCVSHLYNNPTRAKEYIESAYLRVISNYDIKSTADRINQYLNKMKI